MFFHGTKQIIFHIFQQGTRIFAEIGTLFAYVKVSFPEFLTETLYIRRFYYG